MKAGLEDARSCQACFPLLYSPLHFIYIHLRSGHLICQRGGGTLAGNEGLFFTSKGSGEGEGNNTSFQVML